MRTTYGKTARARASRPAISAIPPNYAELRALNIILQPVYGHIGDFCRFHKWQIANYWPRVTMPTNCSRLSAPFGYPHKLRRAVMDPIFAGSGSNCLP